MSFHRILPLVAVVALAAAPSWAAAALPATAAAATAVTSVRFDPSLGAVVVQFRGCIPPYTVGRLLQLPCSYVDFKAPTPLGLAGQRLPGHPLVASWAMSRRSAEITRVSLTFRRWARVRVEPDPARHRVLLFPAVGARQPAPPRPTPTPSPTATPPTPAPVETPKPAASLAPVPPTATAGSGAPARPEPAGFQVRATMGWLSYREQNLAGDTQVQVPAMAVPGFAFAYRLPAASSGWLLSDWHGQTMGSFAAYAFQDRDLPVSIHARQEWRGETSLSRRLGWQNFHAELGAGYLVRYETAAHSGAPPQPSYLFSSMRLFHGPELRVGLRWRLAEDWPSYLEGARLYGEAALAPYVFSRLDAGLQPLPPLAMGRAEYGIEHRLGPVGVRVAYRTWWNGSFGGYEELFQGPVLSLSSAPW